MISLVETSVCVASGFPIATGKHIGDCDLVPSISHLLNYEPHNEGHAHSEKLIINYEGT